eukprot:m.154997 g.154997  ORF g.154997 m.154997 type:complete len:181 (+) comp23543_c0_seq1:61-603(+)
MAAIASLEEFLVPCIQSIFAPDDSARQEAEAQLSVWGDQVAEFPHALSQLICTPEIDTETRQLAAVLLRQYIPDHWDVEPTKRDSVLQVPDEVKGAIRDMIPTALGDPSSRVRSSVAFVVSTIAEFDWPHNWPTLFDTVRAWCCTIAGLSTHPASPHPSETDISRTTPILDAAYPSHFLR